MQAPVLDKTFLRKELSAARPNKLCESSWTSRTATFIVATRVSEANVKLCCIKVANKSVCNTE